MTKTSISSIIAEVVVDLSRSVQCSDLFLKFFSDTDIGFNLRIGCK